MPVYLPSAVLGDDSSLLTFGHTAEIQAWFWPHKDHAQHVGSNLIAIHIHGALHFSFDSIFRREQRYLGDANVLETRLTADSLRLTIVITDVLAEGRATLLRRLRVEHWGDGIAGQLLTLADWNVGSIRTGNGVRFDRPTHALVQTHHDASVAVGGDAVEKWHCGKAGEGWGNNARYAVQHGALACNELEIGDVNFAFGFEFGLGAHERIERTVIYALSSTETGALDAVTHAPSFETTIEAAKAKGMELLAPGLAALGGALLPGDLAAAYRRSLLCLPLLCGEEGVAVAAPEFDPEFIACGGYGYHWPRDGGEYVSGLYDAGYPEYSAKFFDWCAKHQDAGGLWHQRYFLNGQPAPNWCLPPDTLQIDQVGAVLWALGKYLGNKKVKPEKAQIDAWTLMTRRAADYLLSRLTEKGVHGNAFDTWETFIGSFTYSNAAIHAAFLTAHQLTGEEQYLEGARRVKAGVLEHFVKGDEYPYMIRGLDSQGNEDWTVDSASLGAIEPFALLDLHNPRELEIAEGTLRAVTERLDVPWEGGRAIRRFEGDAYVGGVPACVNTLWMARCCLKIADRFDELGRKDVANELTQRAQTYLQTVLHRATPTGLLPELMQGPDGARWWAAPHGWAMSSFVSGTLHLARRMAKE
jgi:oligosaccharide amylase